MLELLQNHNLHMPTPMQPEGPFYPQSEIAKAGNDLVIFENSKQITKGQIIFIKGSVQNQALKKISGALVEIWQACHSGRYHHDEDPSTAPLDHNFKYWGQTITDEAGFYQFRTILPGAYPAEENWLRPPHIHFKVTRHGYQDLITQLYFSDQHLNLTDRFLNQLDSKNKDKIVVNLRTTSTEPDPVGIFNIMLENN